MSDIFISYARSSARQAEQIAGALRAEGYGVWRDDEIPAHRAYTDVIEERLRAARAVVVVWSADAARSEWVRSEAEMAREARKLVQLTIDGARLPMPFGQTQCADLVGWTGDPESPGWRKVVGSIAELTAPGAASRSGRELEATRPRRVSVCVLPFANMSDDPQQEYFSDGISEDIITDLSKVSALQVTARNTAFTFKGRAVDVPLVARQLGVSHVLEGSVRKAGARVRITAQLIDGATGNHLWAERWDRDLDDIFALQDEISSGVVAALKLRLLPEEKRAIERRGTDSVEAYSLYLKARQYYAAGNEGDAGRAEAILRLCRAAIAVDPLYARAWSLMARAQRTLRFNFGRPGDGGAAAAERALELDPDLADARATRARLLSEQGRHGDAATEIKIALRLDPDSFEVTLVAAVLSFQQRRLEDAIRYYEAASALMETSVAAAAALITCYAGVGDAKGVLRAAKMALGRAEQALAQDPSNGAAMGYGVLALAALGETARAKEWARRTVLVDPDNALAPYNLACAMVALGETDAALELLGPHFARSSPSMVSHARIDPDLDPIRDDPRFQSMIAAAGARHAPADEPQSSAT